MSADEGSVNASYVVREKVKKLTGLDGKHEVNAEIGEVASEVGGELVSAGKEREVVVEAVVGGGGKSTRLTDSSTEALAEPLREWRSGQSLFWQGEEGQNEPCSAR
jgi:glycerate-2-kinase